MRNGQYFYPCVFEGKEDPWTREKYVCKRMEFSQEGIAGHMAICHNKHYSKEYGYLISHDRSLRPFEVLHKPWNKDANILEEQVDVL